MSDPPPWVELNTWGLRWTVDHGLLFGETQVEVWPDRIRVRRRRPLWPSVDRTLWLSAITRVAIVGTPTASILPWCLALEFEPLFGVDRVLLQLPTRTRSGVDWLVERFSVLVNEATVPEPLSDEEREARAAALKLG